MNIIDEATPELELITGFSFESAHQLPHAPEHSKCRRLHGHSWRVEVHVAGPLQPTTGWVVDFDDVQRACEPLREALDHRFLNDIEGLENPTSEVIAMWIWERLATAIPGLAAVVVHETCTSRCMYRGPRQGARQTTETA